MKCSIISIDSKYNIKEMKEEIREVIKKHTEAMKDDIHISILYYEINKYKIPKKAK
jgi:septum formation topological specificity factor MinE